jgi:hypothetical protein
VGSTKLDIYVLVKKFPGKFGALIYRPLQYPAIFFQIDCDIAKCLLNDPTTRLGFAFPDLWFYVYVLYVVGCPFVLFLLVIVLSVMFNILLLFCVVFIVLFVFAGLNPGAP